MSQSSDPILGSDNLKELVPFSRSSLFKSAHPHAFVGSGLGNRKAVTMCEITSSEIEAFEVVSNLMFCMQVGCIYTVEDIQWGVCVVFVPRVNVTELVNPAHNAT